MFCHLGYSVRIYYIFVQNIWSFIIIQLVIRNIVE